MAVEERRVVVRVEGVAKEVAEEAGEEVEGAAKVTGAEMKVKVRAAKVKVKEAEMEEGEVTRVVAVKKVGDKMSTR